MDQRGNLVPVTQDEPFVGAKLMLFAGSQLAVLRRDHTSGITWPGCLDFPGGGREGTESPARCALRETEEELGLVIPERDLITAYRRDNAGTISWFFATHQPAHILENVRFGGEGAGWGVMSARGYVDHPDRIPHFGEILAQYMKKAGQPRV